MVLAELNMKMPASCAECKFYFESPMISMCRLVDDVGEEDGRHRPSKCPLLSRITDLPEFNNVLWKLELAEVEIDKLRQGLETCKNCYHKDQQLTAYCNAGHGLGSDYEYCSDWRAKE